MPYTVSDAPTAVKDQFKGKALAAWVATWNSVYGRCVGRGQKASDCESQAFAIATQAAKRTAP